MEKINGTGSAARAGNVPVVLAVSMAVLALAMLGAVLYMQYAEHSYYQAPPSVWPGAPASGAAAVPAASANLALPPAAETAAPPAEPSASDASSDAEEVD